MTPATKDDIRAASDARLREAWREAKLKGQRSPITWAREERRLGRGTGPLAGDDDIPYVPETMPWMIEPTEQAVHPDVQVSVWWYASGMGKTEQGVNIIGYCSDESPRNIFALFPKEDSRDKFSRDVITRAIDSTPALRRTFVERKSRDSGNTISFKSFAGGSLFMTSAGSSSNFRGPRAGLVYLTEVDGYPKDVDGEGDAIALAFKRAEGFAKAIKIIEGTGTFEPETKEDGTIEYRSRIHFWYDQSDKRKWFVKCRKCHAKQWTKGDQIWSPKGEHHKAVYLCEHCEADHNERQWLAMIRNGKWEPTAEFTGIRGYWINAFSTTLPAEKGYVTKLHQFAATREREMKDPATKRVWINTTEAGLTSAQETGEAPPDWKPLFQRREAYTKVPRGGLVITAGCDLQLNRIEVAWYVFSKDGESWGMDHAIIEGDIFKEQVWRDLETELKRKWMRDDGAEMELSIAFIDSGKWGTLVLRFLRILLEMGSSLLTGGHGNGRRVYACRGHSSCPYPFINRKFTPNLSGRLGGYWIGGDEAKDIIYAQLKRKMIEKDDDGNPLETPITPEGYIHYNMSFEEEFFKQLTIERAVVTYDRGKEIRKIRNVKNQRNEAIDTTVYAFAAFRLKPWNFDEIEENLKLKTAEQTEALEKKRLETREAPSVVGRSGGGWSL